MTSEIVPPVGLPETYQGLHQAFPVHHATASLYVGNLHPDVTEATLFELFTQAGSISSIRVCRDNVTRRSLGYAYVNYANQAEADKALELLNYHDIKGKQCRIMWCQRDPSLRKSGVGNIFIKNLHKDIDHKALHDTFSAFGNILSCHVATDDKGNSLGFGFVHYESAESANEAIQKVNGMLLKERAVFVGKHSPKSVRPRSDETEPYFTNIYVKNFSKDVTDEVFTKWFEPFGQITSAVVMRDRATGTSRGFGFVNFGKIESARSAIEKLNGATLESLDPPHPNPEAGKTLYVVRALKRSERISQLLSYYDA